MSKPKPFTHAVWWRTQTPNGLISTWHDKPRLYRSEVSARMAARDLNRFYTDRDMGNYCYHVALPIDMHPDTALPDRYCLNPTFYSS